jgi:2-dehydro-3-deoxygluconokinase
VTGVPRIVGLGEALLRLSTPDQERLEQAGSLRVHVGGAELNALIAAVAGGAAATWMTRLADNPLGRRIVAHARAHGVHAVVDWDAGARAPLYFVEHGVAARPSEVLYDRRGTAMTTLTADAFDWGELVAGADAVLSSGITCALGAQPAAAVTALLEAARARGVRTAFDVNHRARLWSWDDSVPILRGLVDRVDVLLANAHDLERLLGRSGEPVELARAAVEQLGPALVLMRDTVERDGGRIAVTATAVTAEREHVSGAHEAVVVDAFGAGDAALGAFLAALLGDDGLGDAVEAAAWAAAFQHTIPGDATLVRPSDRERAGDVRRRILR